MASLALLVSIILIFIILIGPITIILAKIKFPKIIVYILSTISFISGIWFCSIGIPVWYIGLIPIYCGYVAITTVEKK
jgi:hypothetical protein